MADKFDEVLAQYRAKFNEWPLVVFGVTTDRMVELMQEALEKGRPIPEEDYHNHLPRGADA